MTAAETPSVTLSSGSSMPLIGFGTWQLQRDDAYRSVLAALECGYRHLDTATAYGNESEVGRAVRDSAVPRNEIFVTTKLPPDASARARETIDASLEALGMDHVDLWLIHWPPDGVASPETWERMLTARDDGLTTSVGVSNYSISQIDELIAATDEAPAVNQIPWAPPLFDAGLLTESRARHVVVEGYSPFRRTNLDDPKLKDIADAHAVTPAQVVLRWHVQHEVVAIPKSATPARIASNLDVFGFELSDAEMQRLDALDD